MIERHGVFDDRHRQYRIGGDGSVMGLCPDGHWRAMPHMAERHSSEHVGHDGPDSIMALVRWCPSCEALAKAADEWMRGVSDVRP